VVGVESLTALFFYPRIMENRKKLKKKFVGSYIYCPKKTILSDNLDASTYGIIYKLNPNLFVNATTKKNTKLPK